MRPEATTGNDVHIHAKSRLLLNLELWNQPLTKCSGPSPYCRMSTSWSGRGYCYFSLSYQAPVFITCLNTLSVLWIDSPRRW